MVKGFRADDSAARCESRSLPESFIKALSNLVRRGLFMCAESKHQMNYRFPFGLLSIVVA